MRTVALAAAGGALAIFLSAIAPPARAEVVEEIVAWVNGEIITRSELQEEEEAMIAEAYRRFTGDELDARVKALRENMLVDLIDRKILLDRAKLLFTDLDQIKNVYYEGFKESQNIKDDEEMARLLHREGLTIEGFKTRLLELYAPDEVLRIEVRDRVAVGDAEIRQYYEQHPDEFTVPDEISAREIVLLAKTPEDKEKRRPEARRILEELRAGADFAETAERVSEAGTRSAGGLLGPVKRGDLSEQLEKVAFALPEGATSDLIETDYGFHIIKVESRTVDESKTLDEVRDQLRRYLVERKYTTELEEFKKKARQNAEWCVKSKYRDRVPEDLLSAMTCESL